MTGDPVVGTASCPHLPSRAGAPPAAPAVACAVLAAGAVLSQVAYPLVGGRTRDAVTVLAVWLFFGAAVTHAAAARGAHRAALLVLVTAGGGLLVEAVGTRTGLPFGSYRYTGGLGPSVLGVPLTVCLAWTMMAWPAFAVACRLAATRPRRVLLAAWALASWDLFLDPQMVAAGHWRWAAPSPGLPGAPGVPLSNYAGWVAVAVLVAVAVDAAAGPPPPRAGAGVPEVLYLWTYASSVLAHAAFFGLPGSAWWGGLGMGAVAVPVAASLPRRPARRHQARR